MRIDIVHCDCCKKPIKKETNSGIQGILLLSEIPALNQPPEEVEIDLDDLCDSCAIGLNEVISDFLLRKSNG
jgi:hypothetical protein